MRSNQALPRIGILSEVLGIWEVMMTKMTAMVSSVVKPMVTFSSRSPDSLKGEKTPTMDNVVMMKLGTRNVVM
jgi:hypothetical protein